MKTNGPHLLTLHSMEGPVWDWNGDADWDEVDANNRD